MSVTYLPKKTGTNQSGSGKYFIDCSKRVSKDQPTTQAWLSIQERLKPTNFQDTNRVLLGVLEKQKRVVIKIGESLLLHKEYKVGETLSQTPGFIKYICYFECEDDYKRHDGSATTNLCKAPGNAMKCLIMKYYPLGSLGTYKWGASNFHILKTLLAQCVMSMMMAFEQHGIIHNDTHSKNILLESTKKTVIQYTIANKTYDLPTHGYRIVMMDYENALKSHDKVTGNDLMYKDIGRLVTDLNYSANVAMSKELMECVNSLPVSNPNFTQGITILLPAIARLEWMDPPSSRATLEYDPDVF